MPDFQPAFLPKLFFSQLVLSVKGFFLLLTGEDLKVDLQQLGDTQISSVKHSLMPITGLPGYTAADVVRRPCSDFGMIQCLIVVLLLSLLYFSYQPIASNYKFRSVTTSCKVISVTSALTNHPCLVSNIYSQ